MHDHFHRLAPAMALCLPLLAFAQAGRSDPADPKAPAPPLRYSSAFADYKPWQDIKPADWRAVNDTVRDAAAPAGGAHAGHVAPAAPAGHAGHAGHAGSPPAAAPAQPPAAKPAAKPAAPGTKGHGGHQGHHMPGGQR